MTDLETRHRRAQGVALLLEQVGRRLRERRGPDDLHPVQWSALRYFQRAGRRASTVVGLSRFLGNTAGPTSRTAKSLVDRGLLTVAPAEHDARSVTFALTETGRALLREDPLAAIASGLETMPGDDLARLAVLLEDVLQALDGLRGNEK